MSGGERVRRFATAAFGRSGPLVGSRVLSTVLTFGLPLALARLLTRDGFGTYKQFFLVAQTVLLVGQLGLTQSLFYFLPRGGRERGRYLAQALAGLLALGALCSAALYLGAPSLAAWLGSPDLVAARAPLALYAGAMLAAAPLEGALISESRLFRAAAAYVVSDGLRAGGMVLAAALLGGGALFWAAAGVALLRVAALWLHVARGALPFGVPRRSTARAQLSFALPFAGAALLQVGQRYFAQYAVSAKFDPATFALFAVASFHLPVVDILYTPMSEVLMVELARPGVAGTREALARWHDVVGKLATLLFPAGAGAWLLGGQILPLLFTHRYAGAVPLFFLATFEIPLACFPADAVLRAAGETRYLLAANAARLPITAACILGGMHWFGLAGAIVGGTTSEAIARAILLARGRRFLQARWTELFDWRGLSRLALAAALAALPVLPLRSLSVLKPIWLSLAVATYCAVYFGLLRLLKPARETKAPEPAIAKAA